MTLRFAQIEPTTRCNFTCGFCAGRFMRQGDLPYPAFERFLAMHPDLEHVELQGEGEPLMHARFFDLVSACRARGLRVSLITNGSLLGLETVEQLIHHGVESIHVSLESADADEFRVIRGGKLSKVIDGVRLLVRRRRELGRDRPVVGFSVTILRRTLTAIHDIVELYRELELDGGIGVQLLQDMSCYTDHYDDAMREQQVPHELWRGYAWVVDAAVKRASTRADARSYYGALFAGFDPAAGTCPWLERGGYLTIDGEVMACCFSKKPGQGFGHVLRDSPEEIARRRREAAESLSRGDIPSPCRGCGIADAVTGATRGRKVSLPVVDS
ncbi:radical SAM/SPASM domain-containing protein [Nannocystis pusilla]|uniref:radical SAM protein n=1 Tax=Nannocystis pusilla TaxID=889268 RepID=UPI003DA57C86